MFQGKKLRASYIIATNCTLYFRTRTTVVGEDPGHPTAQGWVAALRDRNLVCACPTTGAALGARPSEDVSSAWEQARRAQRAGAPSGSRAQQACAPLFSRISVAERPKGILGCAAARKGVKERASRG